MQAMKKDKEQEMTTTKTDAIEGRLCELENEVLRLKKQAHSYRCMMAAVMAMFSGYLGEDMKSATPLAPQPEAAPHESYPAGAWKQWE